MKQFISSLLLITAFTITNAQNQPACNPFPKTITVIGSAEMEVVPDEIYVEVDLKEYKRKGEDKVELDKIKNDFLQKCKTIGIADSLISIASYEGNNYNYWYVKKRKKDVDLYATIAYQLKFKESKMMDQLIDILDDDATTNFRIIKATHSKIQEFRKQLKIQAVKAAKDKGIYLSEAINEKLGEAITITEPAEDAFMNNINLDQYSNSLSSYRDGMKEVKNSDIENSAVDFKKIKLR